MHGYYIHGRAPWGRSDVPLTILKKSLDEEGEGKASKRGLMTERPDLQSFEIYLPGSLRSTYDKLYTERLSLRKLQEYSALPQKASDEDEHHVLGGKLANMMGKQIRAKIETSILNVRERMIAQMEARRKNLNEELKRVLSQIKTDPHKYIKQKGVCERLIKKIPEGVDLETLKDYPVLIDDRMMNFPSFTNILMCALDYDILLMNILFFTLFKVVTGNSIVALLIVYVIEKAFLALRRIIGRWNIATKSLTDDRFLI